MVRGATPGFVPGVHRGIFIGSGGRFDGYRTLLQRMEVRRIDPVATRRAGSQIPLVRAYRARVSATVAVLVDLSASMGFADKHREAAKLVACLGYSAAALGDRFAVVGYSDEVEVAVSGLPALVAAIEGALALWQHTPSGQGTALEAACAQLPRRRSLVFWVSDFHLDDGRIEQALSWLHRHDVVLVRLLHAHEFQPAVRWGWSRICDPETGQVQGVWIRPGLLRALERRRQEEHDRMARLAGSPGADVMELARVDIEALAYYLLERRYRP